MYVCAKFESDICIHSYFFRTITKKFTPVKIITDIYTAAQCKYQLLPELLFFENNFFENNLFENNFLNFFLVFDIFFYYSKN